jgi:hypothetical protein
VFAAVLGAAFLRRRLPGSEGVLVRLAVVVALAAGVVLGPLPLWRHVPFGETAGTLDHRISGRTAVVGRALRLVPEGAAVSATNTLGAHLSERRRVFSFPVLAEARWVIADTARMSHRDQADARARGLAALMRLRADPRWRVAFEESGIVVLRRR